MLEIIGGSYLESCIEPTYNELYGSGLRAALALSGKELNIIFYSCICDNFEAHAILKASTFNFKTVFYKIPQTIEFQYYHPLSQPIPILKENNIYNIPDVKGENILYYGMIEATAKVVGNYVVYDPQNHKSFNDTKSSANHLAIILNQKEAKKLSKVQSNDLYLIGRNLLKSEGAEVIVIKNGSQGALVFNDSNVWEIPVFETKNVWPIGTGDIFSAVFAWKWMIERLSPYDSAYFASQFTAQFCESKQLPLKVENLTTRKLEIKKGKKLIYLAGPFFSFGQRFLINEMRNSLIDFGNDVFSPFHDAGVLPENYSNSEAKDITEIDLKNLSISDTVLAVLTGLDAGTIFEIGYAISMGKKVVIFAENISQSDLVMFLGSDCEITNDFSTAIYKASW